MSWRGHECWLGFGPLEAQHTCSATDPPWGLHHCCPRHHCRKGIRVFCSLVILCYQLSAMGELGWWAKAKMPLKQLRPAASRYHGAGACNGGREPKGRLPAKSAAAYVLFCHDMGGTGHLAPIIAACCGANPPPASVACAVRRLKAAGWEPAVHIRTSAAYGTLCMQRCLQSFSPKLSAMNAAWACSTVAAVPGGLAVGMAGATPLPVLLASKAHLRFAPRRFSPALKYCHGFKRVLQLYLQPDGQRSTQGPSRPSGSASEAAQALWGRGATCRVRRQSPLLMPCRSRRAERSGRAAQCCRTADPGESCCMLRLRQATLRP